MGDKWVVSFLETIQTVETPEEGNKKMKLLDVVKLQSNDHTITDPNE